MDPLTPAQVVRVQVRDRASESEHITIYGASVGEVIDEIVRQQMRRGRAVRRGGQLFTPDFKGAGRPSGPAEGTDQDRAPAELESSV